MVTYTGTDCEYLISIEESENRFIVEVWNGSVRLAFVKIPRLNCEISGCQNGAQFEGWKMFDEAGRRLTMMKVTRVCENHVNRLGSRPLEL